MGGASGESKIPKPQKLRLLVLEEVQGAELALAHPVAPRGGGGGDGDEGDAPEEAAEIEGEEEEDEEKWEGESEEVGLAGPQPAADTGGDAASDLEDGGGG